MKTLFVQTLALLLGSVFVAQAARGQDAREARSADGQFENGFTLASGAAKEVGVKEQRLAEAAKMFERAIEQDGLCGAVVLVARRDKIVLHEAYGWRDAARSIPMRKATLFRMASNTKPLTAAAILHLVAEQKVAIDEKVKAYLPAFDNDKSREITIRQLLTHTSGLRIDTLFLPPLRPDTNLQREVDRFAEVGPEVPPGTSYSYSNPGYNTLAAVVEVASGQPFEEYCQEKFYRPLGMPDTCHHETVAENDRQRI